MTSSIPQWWIRYVLPTLVLVVVWYSILSHYYLSIPAIPHAVVERSRHSPADALLEELSKVTFFGDESRGHSVAAAESILRGEFTLPGDRLRTFHIPFDPDDIDQGPPDWQLFQARLVGPRLLMVAYRDTGREEFFRTAKDIILGWASYERRAVLPKGVLWNDHALAERVLALADFWTLYRHHPSYDVETAREVLLFAVRSGRFLADQAHFTVTTNHGVMQNLALWHFSLAFPSLPESERYRQLAFERLQEQMSFYINEEGFVLEHSADYHKAGVQFMSLAFRYMSLLGMQIPDEWRQKYSRAQAVYAHLRRTDGSLPMFGDTGRDEFREDPLVTVTEGDGRYGMLTHKGAWVPHRANSLYPIAGYAVWWDGLSGWPIPKGLSQTVIAWSYFPGQAHKHADDLSVLLWAKGQVWWTNVGYWPYGDARRAQAESWNGSNAPHLVNEAEYRDRTPTIMGHGRKDGANFIDVQRKGPRAYVARRQVVQSSNNLWVVVDWTSGTIGDRTATLWTTAPEVQLKDGTVPGSYDLISHTSDAALKTFLLSSGEASIKIFRGSDVPFAGWQVVDRAGRPAFALMIEQPAHESWSAAIWVLGDNKPGVGEMTAAPSMRSWSGPEYWTVALPLKSGAMTVSRRSDDVLISKGAAGGATRIAIEKPTGQKRRIAEIQRAHAQASQKYPRFGDHLVYRMKATYLVTGLFLLQEVFFFVLWKGASQYALVRGANAVAWLALGLWLTVVRERLIL